jgi:hypothetical protein
MYYVLGHLIVNTLCQVSISCLCAQDYGYGSVRSAVSVSSGNYQKLENIDWNQQQGPNSEMISPERTEALRAVDCGSLDVGTPQQSPVWMTRMCG